MTTHFKLLNPTPAEEVFDRVPINQIDLDVRNHRLVKTPDDDAKLQKAIQANGIQQPIKVNKKDDGRYTLVFGFRRLAAATAIGMESVPALITTGLSTAHIQALQAIENLDRKELHPLEEAQFCQDLADTLIAEHEASANKTPLNINEAVAQHIGRSITWVDRRLAMARLSERVKQVFLNGDIHLGHVNLIARLASHDAQEEVLGMVEAHTPPYYVNESDKRKAELKKPPATLADTRKFVEERLRDLSDVPWDLSASFGGKSPCSSCEHNSANRLELFPEEIPANPQCLLASCYHEKTKLASRAVQKATNTTLKNSGAPTEDSATAAIKERDVDFVKPEAVVEAAKRRQNSQAETPREKKGVTRRQQEEKIHQEFMARLRTWEDAAIDAIFDKLPTTDPLCIAMLLLIHKSGIIQLADGDAKGDARWAAQEKLNVALDLFTSQHKISKAAANHPLAKLVDLLGTELNNEFDLADIELSNYWGDSLYCAVDGLLKRLDITLDIQRQSREDIAAELFPTTHEEE